MLFLCVPYLSVSHIFMILCKYCLLLRLSSSVFVCSGYPMSHDPFLLIHCLSVFVYVTCLCCCHAVCLFLVHEFICSSAHAMCCRVNSKHHTAPSQHNLHAPPAPPRQGESHSNQLQVRSSAHTKNCPS